MIQTIRLQNFRSYKDVLFEFAPGVNIIVGPNASGKTNLLEAVMVLALGRSYKTGDANLIRHTASWARLDGAFGGHTRVLKLQSEADPPKLFLIDDKPRKRLSLADTAPLVYFEPEHLQALTRGPEHRRSFIDDLLGSSEPGFRTAMNTYRRTLAQRNSLLKKGPAVANQQVFAWNIRLAELGSQIASARQELVDLLNKKISTTYSQIAGRKTKVSIEYIRQFPIENYASRMIASLEKNLGLDLARGFTGSGPHREDLKFLISSQPIGDSASRGEVRSLLLSLKKIELELVEKARDQKPILLLDDVLSELDSDRRAALVDIITDHQAILTTTDADATAGFFAHKPRLIKL